MRALQFVKKEIQHAFSSPESLMLMILFPFALTLVLGLAFSSSFSRVIKMPETRLPLVAQGSLQTNLYISQAAQAGLMFEQATLEEAQQQLEDRKAPGYVTLDGDGVQYHARSFGNMEGLLLRTYSRIFAQQANMTGLALKAGRLDLAVPKAGNYIAHESIALDREPDSFGYYGITMLTMIMMYGASQAMGLMGLERRERTDLRLKASPFSMTGVYLAKSGMSIFTLLVQALILMIMNTLAFGVDYRSIPLVLLMLIPFAFFCNGLGILAYQAADNERSANGFLNLLIVVLVFLGGGYVPLRQFGGLMEKLADYSPVGMINQGMIDYIYTNQFSGMLRAMAFTGSLGIVMLLIAYMLYKREEGSHRVAGA